jgi:hypothetical protein
MAIIKCILKFCGDGGAAGQVHPEAQKVWQGGRHKPLSSRREGAVHPFSVRILAGEPGTDTKNSCLLILILILNYQSVFTSQNTSGQKLGGGGGL